MEEQREIKFRGKRTRGGEWVYGNLFYWKKYGKLIPIVGEGVQNGSVQGNEVDPKTVGQFTSLKDKNGREIYEGDIFRIESEKLMVVSWNKSFASFCLNREGWLFSHWFGESCDPEACEIMGNIYENQNLLAT